MKVRESLHLPCSQQSFSLQQLAPPWQTNALLLVEVEEEEEATSAVQQVAWVDFKDQNWWCSRLPKCNHGGEKYSPLCSLLKPPPRSSKLGWDNTAWSRYSRSPKWGRCRQPKMKSCLCKIELEFIWTLNLFRCSWVHEGALKNLLLYLGAAVRNRVATSSRGLLGGLREENQFFNCYISCLKYLCALVVNQ